MNEFLTTFAQSLGSTLWDVFPIAAVFIGFQVVALRKPVPQLKSVVTGFVLVTAPERLVLETVLSAQDQGAHCLNYNEVVALEEVPEGLRVDARDASGILRCDRPVQGGPLHQRQPRGEPR